MINDERVMTSGTRLLCTVVQNRIKSHFHINAAYRIDELNKDVPKVRLFIVFVNRFVYLTSQKLRHQKVSLI